MSPKKIARSPSSCVNSGHTESVTSDIPHYNLLLLKSMFTALGPISCQVNGNKNRPSKRTKKERNALPRVVKWAILIKIYKSCYVVK